MEGKIFDIKMTPADNGVVICYMMKSQMEGRTFDYTMMEHKEVFQFKSGSNAEKMAAMNRFLEICDMAGMPCYHEGGEEMEEKEGYEED